MIKTIKTIFLFSFLAGSILTSAMAQVPSPSLNPANRSYSPAVTAWRTQQTLAATYFNQAGKGESQNDLEYTATGEGTDYLAAIKVGSIGMATKKDGTAADAPESWKMNLTREGDLRYYGLGFSVALESNLGMRLTIGQVFTAIEDSQGVNLDGSGMLISVGLSVGL